MNWFTMKNFLQDDAGSFFGRAVKWLSLLLLLAALLVGCQQARHSGGPSLVTPKGDTVRLATYNVHYIWLDRASGPWSAGEWEDRKTPLAETVRALQADLIAFQEMESFGGGNDDSQNLARTWLLSELPEFAAAAIGDWRDFPSTQPIFYRKERVTLLDQGWFFFSETPDVIYSRTFNGSYPAFASWADFDIDGGVLRVVNVHTDFASRENRTKSVALVAERVRTWREEGRAVVLAGDLNARLGSGLHDTLERAGLTFVPVSGATYHFDRGLNLFGAIDHIAYSDDLEPSGAPVVLREKLGDIWPSDHYPVIADFQWK